MKKQKDGKSKKRKIKLFFLISAVFFLTVVTVVAVSSRLILNVSKGRVYKTIETLPANDVGLVLGTVKLTTDGRPNLHFKYRIEAAAELFKHGKIKHILVSGDNHRKGYDEPSDMKDALIALGVPADRITLDYAGFRTLDSVVRVDKIFGQSKFTIISQEYHNYRAVFIGRAYDLDVIAYCAKPATFSKSAKTEVRELFARVKAVLDIYLLRKEPKFLGEFVPIRIANNIAS